MPFYQFELQVAQPKQVVMQRVQKITRPIPTFWQSLKDSFAIRPDDGIRFIGAVGEDSFSIYRDIRYRNSFLPLVYGSVVDTPLGSRVKVTMRLHLFVAIFMTVWLGLIGNAAFSGLANSHASFAVNLPTGMFVFGMALVLGAFYPEAFKARKFLEQAIRDSSA